MKSKKIRRVWKHHNWLKTADGIIDEWGWESGIHNGPICNNCGYCYCVNCEEAAHVEEVPCMEQEERCGNCGKLVVASDTYCSNCGTKIEHAEEYEIIEMEG